MTVFAGQNHRPTRAADRIGAEAVFKQHPLAGELIDIGRGIDRFIEPVIRPDRMGRMIVRKNKQNIRAVTFFILGFFRSGNLRKHQCNGKD